MWIQVRSFDGKKLIRVDGLSKLTKIENLRDQLVDQFEAQPEQQRLFFRGKQLENGHSLFDYGVGINDVVQIMVRKAVAIVKSEENSEGSSGDESSHSNKENSEPNIPIPKTPEKSGAKPDSQDSGFGDDLEGATYKLGDVIDAMDCEQGAWYEAEITKIWRGKPDELKDKYEESEIKVKDNKPKQEDKSEPEKVDENANQEKDNIKDDDKMETDEVEKNNEINEKSNEINEKSDENVDGVKDNKIDDSASDVSTSSKQSTSLDIVNNDITLTKNPIDGFIYQIKYDGYEDDGDNKLTSRYIRPRARNNIKFTDVKVGDKVTINYNELDEDQRGFWYDAIVTRKTDTRTKKELFASIFVGTAASVRLDNCKVLFINEVMSIEQPGSQLNVNTHGAAASPVKRTNKAECDHCLDNKKKKCKFCGCQTCGIKKDLDKTLLCDECNLPYHTYCVDPPVKLEDIPEDEDWYCPVCRNNTDEVIKAGQKLKESKKKAKMASSTTTSNRDWGKGMACAGRMKICNTVPPNHFGPIPGVEVGSTWRFRLGASEVGIHRPHVAGIHGRDSEGAYSVVLSGGYEDDTDNGDEFFYTGSGGRDLSGNKRTAEQSCDQTLTRMNRALARNCNAPIDDKKGAEAKDWQKGKPLRVVRNVKCAKHSKYAPEEGNRYDGIYKVVKYWPAKGKKGFIVWRYLMRRDDPVPAPWTKAGKKRIAELGLTIQYPEGYLEAQAEKEKQKDAEKGGKGKGKRKRGSDSESSSEDEPASSNKSTPSKASTPKRKKVAAYKINPDTAKLIAQDEQNKKVWDEAMKFTKEGGQVFLGKVEEMFGCICCQDIVCRPITVKCSHNICKDCLSRSFKAEVYSCPACREELGKNYSMATNKPLTAALQALFPGYESGR